jgi:hypothetical protein
MKNKAYEMKTSEDLQTMLDLIRDKSIKLVKEQLSRIKTILEQGEPEADFDGFLDLPNSIVFIDMEDGNLIENIERIHTSGNKVEVVLHGDGRDIEIEDLDTRQIILVLKQLEGITTPQQIEVA